MSFIWSKKSIEILTWSTLDGEPTKAIAARLGCERTTVRRMQFELGLAEPQVQKVWSDEEAALLRQLYPDTPTEELARKFRCSAAQVYGEAGRRGLTKSREYLTSQAKRTLGAITTSRFKPGLVPWNKGKRNPGSSTGRMSETQFKKGRHPHSWHPVGSVRTTKDGYLQRKVFDTGHPPRDWKGVHILLWEEAHGPVPADHAVCFKDGDRKNVILDNLELISRRELMARNTLHRLPKPLVQVIRLNCVLKRKIRRLNAA